MPYDGQPSGAASHFDFIKNPDITTFLEQCDYLREPSDEEGERIARLFGLPPVTDDTPLPERVVATDGSVYESTFNNRLPSSKVGYVKVNALMIDLTEFDALRTDDRQFVDPFKVAKLRKGRDALVLALPSANVLYRGKTTVREGFRAALDEFLYGEKTRFSADNPSTSLRTTLFHLAARRGGALGTRDSARFLLPNCPSCGVKNIEIRDIPDDQFCDQCGKQVYPSDCLRLWEEVSDFQSSYSALTRCMLQLEHMMVIHYLRYLMENMPEVVPNFAFFVDGPLAVFGQGAWLHGAIMEYLAEVRREMANRGESDLLIVGLQKTGQLVDHVGLIERFVPRNRLFAVPDDYRYQYVLSRDPSQTGFGNETYYGQDFIYRTATGRTFVFAIPYTVEQKAPPKIFHANKTDWNLYPNLARALRLIDHFESDLYRNAVIPIALAHRYTAISLSPGGKVLDILTRRAMT